MRGKKHTENEGRMKERSYLSSSNHQDFMLHHCKQIRKIGSLIPSKKRGVKGMLPLGCLPHWGREEVTLQTSYESE